MDLSQKLGTQTKKLLNKTPEMYAELFDLTGQNELPVLLGAWYRLQFFFAPNCSYSYHPGTSEYLTRVLDECGSSTIKVDA